MAETKTASRKAKVKMFGTGNFVINKTLYVFRDSEEVEVQQKSHKTILEAESKRREANAERITLLDASAKKGV